MLIFLILFIFLVSLSFLHFKFKQFKDNYKLAYFFTFLLMLAVATFRDPSVGVDGGTYKQWFETIPPITQWLDPNFSFDNVVIRNAELSFTIFSGIAKVFSSHISSLFFIYALISLVAHFYSFHRYIFKGNLFQKHEHILPSLLFLTILLYYMDGYILRDLAVMRLGAGIGVSLLAIEPLYYKKNLKFFIITGIAIFIHAATLILILPWFLSLTNLIESRLTMIGGLILSILVGSVGISDYLISVLPNLGYVTNKVINYSESKYAQEIGFFSFINILNILIFLILLYFKKYLEKRNIFFNILMLFFVSGTYIRFIFNDFGILGGRFGNILTSCYVIIIPLLLTCYTPKSRFITWLVISLLAFSGVYLNLISRDNFGGYMLSF